MQIHSHLTGVFRQLDDLTAQVETYETLLRNIYLHPDHHPDTSVNQPGAVDAHSHPLNKVNISPLEIILSSDNV
jgi:hypothetical protein